MFYALIGASAVIVAIAVVALFRWGMRKAVEAGVEKGLNQ